jgi:hypothetical protein
MAETSPHELITWNVNTNNPFKNSNFEKVRVLLHGYWYEGDISAEPLIRLKPVVEQEPINSAHSFTEGSEESQSQRSGCFIKGSGSVIPDGNNTLEINSTKEDYEKSRKAFPEFKEVDSKESETQPSIDQQIELLKEMRRILDQKYLSTRAHDKASRAIIENLLAIKRFSQSTALHNVDVEKVIEDLLEPAKNYIEERSSEEEANNDPSIQNAEAALGMLQAFKKERDVTAKDVYEAFQNLPKQDVKKRLDEDQIRKKLWRGLENNGPLGEVDAILDAIDSMIKLRSL